jgi:type IV secretory pathway protease TraF
VERVVRMVLEALGLGLALRSAGVICFNGYGVVFSASMTLGLHQ